MKELKHMKREQGFTLVEIAIVLVIIGLLLGAVFKGQELIAQSKIKNVTKKIDEVRAATYTFLDKYNVLPGDGTVDIDGDGATTTAGEAGGGTADDGQIDNTTFWQALNLAGMIEGGGNPLKTPYGTNMHVAYGVAGISDNAVCALVPQDVAKQIDTKYDDGSGTTGTYVGGGTGATPANAATAYAAGNNWICTKL